MISYQRIQVPTMLHLTRRTKRTAHDVVHAMTISVVSLLLLLLLQLQGLVTVVVVVQVQAILIDGPTSYKKGVTLYEQQKYDDAAVELWNAILFHDNTPIEDRNYNVPETFNMFITCYIQQNKLIDGLLFVSYESYRRNQYDMGNSYLQQAIAIDPNHPKVLQIQDEFVAKAESLNTLNTMSKQKRKKIEIDDDDYGDDDVSISSSAYGKMDDPIYSKTPEELYEVASQHFTNKEYEACVDVFTLSCIKSQYTLFPSCANTIYCRSMIMEYGYNGTQYDTDIQTIYHIIQQETKLYRYYDNTTSADSSTDSSSLPIPHWRRASSVHPHMLLGYPIDPILKKYVAESIAYMDEPMSRAILSPTTKQMTVPPLPSNLPYSVDIYRTKFQNERNKAMLSTNDLQQQVYKIRIGFVGSGFNSKAVLFLSHDMFRFFDTNQYEIHIFCFNPPDHTMFIQHGMRNVDWRKRVQQNVYQFHDLLAMNISKDHIKAAQYIHTQQMHILIEWDGYARQGERAQGLFALRPAPIQILHQEYLGTSGAVQYVDYLFTDIITSPISTQDLYTEKLIYMPNHFFSKGHALQNEVKKPTYQYLPKTTPYQLGTGSPIENRCLSPKNVGPKNVSFVYCNFNKLLKANPETIRSWIHILRNVPNSILCLLENPADAIPYLRKFVHETTGTSNNHSDPTTYVPGDGTSINERIHFLSWEKNPFDHQTRNQDFCHVMLDSYPYNGHTVAQDALYGGVPIVTRSDGTDMSSRVTTSANVVLGLDHILNAYNGIQQYESIAIELGLNTTLYNSVRTQLIDTCLQRNPMHPYWDVPRYVKNFERAISTIWDRFLNNVSPDHIYIEEDDTTKLGTYDDVILANPPEGKGSQQTTSNTVME